MICVKYVFPAKIWFMKTSTRIMKYKSRVTKSNPGTPNFSLEKRKMVTGLTNKYHPLVLCLSHITHKQVYYADCKKQYEDIITDIIT